MLFKVLKNLQENNCVAVSFILKLQDSDIKMIKEETLTQVFSIEFFGIFQSTIFYKRHLVAVSASWTNCDLVVNEYKQRQNLQRKLRSYLLIIVSRNQKTHESEAYLQILDMGREERWGLDQVQIGTCFVSQLRKWYKRVWYFFIALIIKNII